MGQGQEVHARNLMNLFMTNVCDVFFFYVYAVSLLFTDI